MRIFLGINVGIELGISPIPTIIKNWDTSYEINTPQDKGVIITSNHSILVFCLLS